MIIVIIAVMLLGGEFTSPNQERFHHYKVESIIYPRNVMLLSLSPKFTMYVYPFIICDAGLLGVGLENKPMGATEL